MDATCQTQRLLLRDRRRVTTACTACWAMGKNLAAASDENIFVLDRLEQPTQDKNLLYRPNGPNEPMEGPLSNVLLESPFQNPVRLSISLRCQSYKSLLSSRRQFNGAAVLHKKNYKNSEGGESAVEIRLISKKAMESIA
jgi:hypothetical protein